MNYSSLKTIDIQGHRGCRGLMPENTIQAFDKAIDLGVHTLELDVVVSKDSVVVVSHEPFISRKYCFDLTGNDISKGLDKAFNLYQMTFDSIKQFDCGSKVYPKFPEQKKLRTYKPSLDEVIKVTKGKNPKIKFNIELKARPAYDTIYTPIPKEFVQLVLEVVNKNDAFYETNLQCFDLRILEEIKNQSPHMVVALLVDENENIKDKLVKMSYAPEIISPYFKLLDAKTVRSLQAKNFKVIPWTVNKNENLQRMIDFGVDGIITDYPDRLIKLIR
ncbi:glycerophosphodiester phosphodiesterase family protein [Seonamhaeicola sp. ML3]|uniref:glycerophosphodiester phosphodiesterase family protein n=1 Tax=Seonamhaeicola sp. ML3 TaxID=2937786 RepID=UPI00200D4874|nr:glycerophosphodiester phosphodiesterase family protein [Seonamhaeicola sp. ML3]